MIEPGVVTSHPDSVAAPLLSGFNKYSLPANDDGSTGAVKLPFTVQFFSNKYKSLYVNNNGNITFGGSMSQYTPQELGSLGLPVIAPFWGDVDTRVGNVVTYGSGTVEGHKAFGVTWPGVGCFSEKDSAPNTFQVILISRSDIASGDFEIEFNYGYIQWESGEASGGNSNCLGGTPARAGYASGTGFSYELPGSGQSGALLSSTLVTGLTNQSYGSSESGRDVFPVRGGQPTPISGSGPPYTSSRYTDCAKGEPEEIADGKSEVPFRPCMTVEDAHNGISAYNESIEPPPNSVKSGGCPHDPQHSHGDSSLLCTVKSQSSVPSGSGVVDSVTMELNWASSTVVSDGDTTYYRDELETDTMTVSITTSATGKQKGSSSEQFVSKEVIEGSV